MTLVVGEVTAKGGYMIADTLLTFPLSLTENEKLAKEKNHALKVQIFAPDLVVAFAGNTKAAIECLSAAQAQKENLAQYLLDHCRSLKTTENDDCEYLLMQKKTNNNYSLNHITEAGIRSCTKAYIGDPEEYQKFMKLLRPYDSPTRKSLTELGIKSIEASNAMESLSQKGGGTVGTIGNFVIRVSTTDSRNDFEYLESVTVVLETQGPSRSINLTSNKEKYGFGIYYSWGNVGFLFVVGDTEPCRRIEASSVEAFMEIANNYYGTHFDHAM